MSQLDTLKARFRSCRKTFPWSDFIRLIGMLGYSQISSGSGSGRKYYNEAANDLITLHEPHGNQMEPGMVKRLQKHLKEKRLI
jgi:HicA toxin of bacterial toxin-antitoxin,